MKKKKDKKQLNGVVFMQARLPKRVLRSNQKLGDKPPSLTLSDPQESKDKKTLTCFGPRTQSGWLVAGRNRSLGEKCRLKPSFFFIPFPGFQESTLQIGKGIETEFFDDLRIAAGPVGAKKLLVFFAREKRGVAENPSPCLRGQGAGFGHPEGKI